ncbi:MAG TPA: peptidase [Pirellulales bacterium]|nr:peptidase [Pirellulales bacterium]
MSRTQRWGGGRSWAVLALVLLALSAEARADRFELKDGRVLEGRMAKVASFAEKVLTAPPEGAPDPRLIIMVDDDLRRTFVPKALVVKAGRPDAGPAFERFDVPQRATRTGGKAVQLGAFITQGPWDEWGRRTVTMNFGGQPISIIQGITQITPRWTKVEALQQAGTRNFIWDMRIATSAIPPDTLRKVITRRIDPKKVDDRLKLVRLFLQSERYGDARQELEQVIVDFPESEKQLAPTLRELKQLDARRTLTEINLRRRAGQQQLADQWLLEWRANFGTAGVAGEIVKSVEQAIERSRIEHEQHTEIIKRLGADAAALAANDPVLGQRLVPIVNEINTELTINSLGRMAAYQQFAANPDIEEKVALAVSGWLVGTNDAVRKLPIALSLFETRDLVRRYLAEPVKAKRDQIVVELEAQEGATPELVAKLLAHMRPPLPAPEPDQKRPGFFELQVDAVAGEPPVTYYVQLPPEYDPYRIYPTVVTLRAVATTPEQQIEWWAGPWSDGGMRLGQASRHGYIVIAPAWAMQDQTGYRFSAAEHAAVLNSLRDACRRFSIDVDRVFLSGHSMGGDAAWDMGLAHPDLWAGVVPIVARADKYISRIWENGRHLHAYLVGGELDGDKPAQNAKDLDRYMKNSYNVTVVEYEGRGHEDFSDEIHRLFDWMNHSVRDFFPKDFHCRSMRSWDNYFWWVELDEFPAKAIVDPEDWPSQGKRPGLTKATANAKNGLSVTTAADKVTFCLSPGIIDFKLKATLTANGAKARLEDGYVEADLKVMLDDARSRGDRRHPFWAKIEVLGGKTKVAERGKKKT